VQRFYVGRPISGLVWLLTLGLFGVGWVIDVFLIPEFVEEHNKKVFHQQMLETGNSLLFDGEPYGVSVYSAEAPLGAP
jgi:TM2 domain-containing membrane protein YozV